MLSAFSPYFSLANPLRATFPWILLNISLVNTLAYVGSSFGLSGSWISGVGALISPHPTNVNNEAKPITSNFVPFFHIILLITGFMY